MRLGRALVADSHPSARIFMAEVPFRKVVMEGTRMFVSLYHFDFICFFMHQKKVIGGNLKGN